jgi:hypothetical protein
MIIANTRTRNPRRASAWRKKILDGVLRVALCHDGSRLSKDDLLHFGKCLDARFSIEDCQRVVQRVAQCPNKSVRRSTFEGIFCLFCEK